MVNFQSLCVIIAVLSLLLAVICLLCFGVEYLIYSHALASGVTKATLDYGRLHAALTAVTGFGFWFALWFLQDIPFQRARKRNRRSG